MAHGTVGFFEPADPTLGLDSSWEFQDGGGKSTSSTRDSDLGFTAHIDPEDGSLFDVEYTDPA